MTGPKLAAAHHVNIVVRDIEPALLFYTDVLGLAVRDRVRVGEPELGRGLGVPGADLDAVFLELPGADMTVEMVEYKSGGSDRGDRFPPASTPGFGHVAFRVADIDTAHADLRSAGVEFVSSPVTLADGTRFCFFRDPDGNILELIQPV